MKKTFMVVFAVFVSSMNASEDLHKGITTHDRQLMERHIKRSHSPATAFNYKDNLELLGTLFLLTSNKHIAKNMMEKIRDRDSKNILQFILLSPYKDKQIVQKLFENCVCVVGKKFLSNAKIEKGLKNIQDNETMRDYECILNENGFLKREHKTIGRVDTLPVHWYNDKLITCDD